MNLLFLMLANFNVALGANILGIWFHGGKSHHILGEVLFKELARKGHNVTMASPFPLKEAFPNYTDVYLTGIQEDHKSREEIFLKMNKNGFIDTYKYGVSLITAQIEMTLTHPKLQELYESGTKFDLIIIDWLLNNAILYFGKLFGAPVIPLSSGGAMPLSSYITGNPWPISYVPLPMFFLPGDDITYFQRLRHTLVWMASEFFTYHMIGYNQDLIRIHFNDTLTYDEMRNIVALIFSNGHYSFEKPRPYVPNHIPIGGFHVTKPEKLPENLQAFMDGAEQGVIFFSLGSNVKSILLPDKIKQDILSVFSKLPYRVIWKWEDEEMKGKPPNVMVLRWCPQNSILAHPKTKLFISHAGLLSTIEAIYFGVPILGIPIFGDQRINIRDAVVNGHAVLLELKDLNVSTFSFAINEIISNKKYREVAKNRSELLRDQPISPMDSAVFWVEHVIKHKGGKHLRNQGAVLPWYQYHLIDVILFLGVLFISIFVLIVLLIKKIINILISKFSNTSDEKKLK